jgi:hypothetical protein
MADSDKQLVEQLRARGRGRFILVQGLLQWGVPFGAFVTLGQLLSEFVMHTPYRPLLLPRPVWNELAEFMILAFVFGYLAGETRWRSLVARL